MNLKVKICVIVLALILLGIGILGATRVKTGLSQFDVLPSKSFVKDFHILQDKYFGGRNFFDVIIGKIDYSDPKIQNKIFAMEQVLLHSGYTEGNITNWLRDFLEWVSRTKLPINLVNGRPSNEKNFYMALYVWMANPINYLKYSDKIVFQYGVIKTSRLEARHPPIISDQEKANYMLEVRKICESFGIGAFAHATKYVHWTQFVNLIVNNIISFSVVAGSIFLTVWAFLGNAKLSIIVIFTIIMIDIDLLGVMYFWQISLNNVSLTLMLISIGLAVDACAHIAHAFAANKQFGNRGAIDSLEQMGGAVFSGAFTSFLGISVLSAASHTILFIFFKFFFAMFLFSVIHGLAVLPVILSFIKPIKTNTESLEIN